MASTSHVCGCIDGSAHLYVVAASSVLFLLGGVLFCVVCWLFVFVAGSNPFVSTSRSSSRRKSVPIPGHTTSRAQRERGTKVCGLVYIHTVMCSLCVLVHEREVLTSFIVFVREKYLILVQSISQNCVVSV